jgi:hypothetical protein
VDRDEAAVKHSGAERQTATDEQMKPLNAKPLCDSCKPRVERAVSGSIAMTGVFSGLW